MNIIIINDNDKDFAIDEEMSRTNELIDIVRNNFKEHPDEPMYNMDAILYAADEFKKITSMTIDKEYMEEIKSFIEGE